jgi:LPXTG-motif cell wall-anchored protein
VLITTAAGMHGNAPVNDVVRSSSSDSLPWIVAGALAGVGAIAVVFVRRRREHTR